MPKKKTTPQEEMTIVNGRLPHGGKNRKMKVSTAMEIMLRLLLKSPSAEETGGEGQRHKDHETEDKLKAQLEEAEYVRGTKGPRRSPGHPE